MAARPCRNGWRPARWWTSLEPWLIRVPSTSPRLDRGHPPTPCRRRLTPRQERGRREPPWHPARCGCTSTPHCASCCRAGAASAASSTFLTTRLPRLGISSRACLLYTSDAADDLLCVD